MKGLEDLTLSISFWFESLVVAKAFARQQIELFEAQDVDTQTGAQGRNKPVQMGQVGKKKMLFVFGIDMSCILSFVSSRIVLFFLPSLLLGIRCIHCADLHPKLRTRAAVYYPSRLTVLYQAAQNIVNIHLPELCESMPEDIRAKLVKLENKRSSVGGGKNYWSDTAQIQGIIDTDNGLRFDESKIGSGP